MGYPKIPLSTCGTLAGQEGPTRLRARCYPACLDIRSTGSEGQPRNSYSNYFSILGFDSRRRVGPNPDLSTEPGQTRPIDPPRWRGCRAGRDREIDLDAARC